MFFTRQMSLQRVRRERQSLVREKRADLEQKRLQQLVRQPYHAFCGNINTGPDGKDSKCHAHRHISTQWNYLAFIKEYSITNEIYKVGLSIDKKKLTN